MTYTSRYKKLNEKQRQAVDTIDGPLLVLAGPGTGKTELLSMRAANILEKTDTLPSSILCLTFTDSGATAMRERLADIIGADAYKVAIHTFHSFGTEIINQNAEYFFRGAQFQPADELAQYEILRGIFDEMEYTNPLAGMNGDEYTHLRDARTVISELKRSGLTSEELIQIIDANTTVLDEIESDITNIFANKISKTSIHLLAPVAEKVARIIQPKLPPAITPYASTLALSIAHAVDEAIETDSTKPVTAWKNSWCEKNEHGEMVFKDRRRDNKLRALAQVYFQYLSRLQAAGLFDYDDMILEVIHTMETQPALRANLQEKYQYVMVDEFQDTNLAQLRMLFDLTNNVEQPNVMAVGDDDQAIYSFQGADVGNIQRFRSEYSDPTVIVLVDNYRSAPAVLQSARSVITQGKDRLEGNIDDLVKELTPHVSSAKSSVQLHEYTSAGDERHGIAQSVKALIASGESPDTIAVFARRHHELISLLPYLASAGIKVNYERRENVLDHEIIRLIEHLLMIIDALHRDAHDEADALIPEILAHPAWGYDPTDIYRLSLGSYRNHQLWLESMQTRPVFKSFADWLIVRTAAIHVDSLETQIDALLGVAPGSEQREAASTRTTSAARESTGVETPFDPRSEASEGEDASAESDNHHADVTARSLGETSAAPLFPDDDQEITGAKPLRREDVLSENGTDGETNAVYTSPLYNYFFSEKKLAEQPDAYLAALEALRTIRDQLREHYGHDTPSVQTFLEFLAMHRELGSSITAVRRRGEGAHDTVQLMSAHKSKGLEYEHVFVINAVDSMWGERVRTRSRLISYPANLPLAPAGDTFDERLRLFFVAMTRAKRTLSISYSSQGMSEKSTLIASFLSDVDIETTRHDASSDIAELTHHVELDWRGRIASSIDTDLRELLAPTLERYKLSATHLGNFLDISQGGPHHFLLNNLLKFPQSKSAQANYGTAIHATLQRAHDFYRALGEKRPIEDVLGDYERILRDQHMTEPDFETFYSRGIDSLSAYLTSKYDTFSPSQRTEIGFGSQGVVIEGARLTGALDLVNIDEHEKIIRVTDYKTGKPSRDWKGKTEYERIKLHKYRQQLMFYQLLVENSRDYSKYSFDGGVLQFVEPSPAGKILSLDESFSPEEMQRFRTLIHAVWQRIMTLDLPDISGYEPTLKGIEKFEAELIDNIDIS